MSSCLSWSQLVTIMVTTFVCTLTGLRVHHRLTSKHEKQDKKKSAKSISKQKATEFWDNYHCDECATSEWFADWTQLKPFILAQITKIMNHNENRNKMNKSDVKILILGNGLSEIPIHLHKNGFANLTATDVSVTAINTMKQKHKAKYPNIKWLVADCTDMTDVFEDNSFDFIFEKGVSDTLQYRRPSKESNLLLQKMFSEISRLLDNTYGKYLCVTPRRKVPLLKLVRFKWCVKRTQIGEFAGNQTFLYLHVCTKINNKHHLMIMKNQQNDRRKQFEKASNDLEELKALNLKFEPLIEIKDIEKDILIPFKHYQQDISTNNRNDDLRAQGIIKEIDGFYYIHGLIEYKRKFGKKLMFYRVSLMDDVNINKKQTIQCIAERSFVAKLRNPKLKQEFATNYLIQCGDEVKIYGKLGITNQGILSLFVYYVSLIQYHCNWKYESILTKK